MAIPTPKPFTKTEVEKHNLMLQFQMYEDFSADHANKTITMETHPHLPGPPQVY